MLVTRLATGVRDCPVKVDHLTAEITLDLVTHLSRFNVKVLHLDVEFMQRTGRQSDKNLLSVVWVSLLRRVREHPILALLSAAARSNRDRLGELIGDVVSFVVSKPGVITRRKWVLGVNSVLVSHTRIM